MLKKPTLLQCVQTNNLNGHQSMNLDKALVFFLKAIKPNCSLIFFCYSGSQNQKQTLGCSKYAGNTYLELVRHLKESFSTYKILLILKQWLWGRLAVCLYKSAAGVLRYISRTQPPTLSFANMYLKKWKLLDILLSLITNICCKR